METLARVSRDPEFTHLGKFPGLRFELKYATDDNFVGKNVYGPFTQPFLQKDAAQMLARAAELLREEKPGYSLLIYDSLRPRSVQRILYSYVEGTPNQKYVAHPDRGGMHCFGCAVDLTACDEHGMPLDMGTGFDAFEELSEPRKEPQFLEQGKLTVAQIENRLILRRAMTGAGFHQLPHEWWHYDAFPGDWVRANLKIVE